ncbi:speedy protein A-like [Artemia franciscana]|uniref:Uncharacterized protein n=2 Tax=Artemia franciscana TaxID=6661 RepID=A0AA88KU71_ARTSF|nr:hypothetical protein QYM36_015005 [Artemia franciscana]
MSSNSSSRQTIQKGNATDLVTLENFQNFIFLLNDEGISLLMDQDRCYITTDKYMLAYSLVLMARAGWLAHNLSPQKFYAALYLAHEMEEDIEDGRWELIPWAYPMLSIEKGHIQLQKLRWELFEKISFKALVSKIACEEVIKISCMERIWKRERKVHHAGAVRPVNLDEVFEPVGPYGKLKPCSECRSLFTRPKTTRAAAFRNIFSAENSSSTLTEDRDYSVDIEYGFLTNDEMIHTSFQEKTLLMEFPNPRFATRAKVNRPIKSLMKENQTQNVTAVRTYLGKRPTPFNDSTLEMNIMDINSPRRCAKRFSIEDWLEDVSVRVFDP